VRPVPARQSRRGGVLRRVRGPPAGRVSRLPGAEPAVEQVLRALRPAPRRRRRARAGLGTGRGRGAAAGSRGPGGALRVARGVHAEAPRREDPDLAERGRRRAQAGDRPVHRRLGVHGDVREARPRGGARYHGPRLRGDPGRGPSVRGHDQPVPRGRRHGPVRRAHRPRGPRPSRAPRRARDPGGARPPPPRRPARPRRGVPRPDRDQHGPRRRRRDRPRPPDGLHGRR